MRLLGPDSRSERQIREIYRSNPSRPDLIMRKKDEDQFRVVQDLTNPKRRIRVRNIDALPAPERTATAQK